MAKAKLKTDFLYVPAPGLAVELECQFNPEQLKMSKTVSYNGNSTPARDFPRTEYGGGNAATYSLDLYFDSYWASNAGKYAARKDVREQTNKLMAMSLKMSGYGTTVQFPYLMEPPSVLFIWGDVKLFRAVLTSVELVFTQFDKDGAPTRAKASCRFLEQSHPMDFMPAQNPSSRTDPRQTVRVSQGDRLDLLASNIFGDSRKWRAIAMANDIDDPFNLEAGRLLSIPLDEY